MKIIQSPEQAGSTPLARGYAMPAEWEPHEATWIAWPHNATDWPGKFRAVEWVFTEMVRRLSAGETVRIVVDSESREQRAKSMLKKVGVDMQSVEFFQFPTNRSWIRDYGPMFVCKGPKTTREVAASGFRFNAWAKYDDWELDNAVPELICDALGIKLFPASKNGIDVVFEGGAIDVNGSGTLVTTEECLLDNAVQSRNPGLSKKEMEVVLRDYLGVENVLWLGRGIAGDDTHGHVDDICRFVNRSTVVAAVEDNPGDPNYAPLRENLERIGDFRLEDGSTPEVIKLPMPGPLYFDGTRLPASYANFYISNSSVLAPTFNDPCDRAALGILAELFPGREVLGIHSLDLIWGLGAVHCITREQPAAI